MDKIEFVDSGDLEITFSGVKPFSFLCPSKASKLAWKSNFSKALEESNKPRLSNVVHILSLEASESKKPHKIAKRSITEIQRNTLGDSNSELNRKQQKKLQKQQQQRDNYSKAASVRTVRNSEEGSQTHRIGGGAKEIDQYKPVKTHTQMVLVSPRRFSPANGEQDRKTVAYGKLRDAQTLLLRTKANLNLSNDLKELESRLEKYKSVLKLLNRLDNSQPDSPEDPSITLESVKNSVFFLIKKISNQLAELKTQVGKLHEEDRLSILDDALSLILESN